MEQDAVNRASRQSTSADVIRGSSPELGQGGRAFRLDRVQMSWVPCEEWPDQPGGRGRQKLSQPWPSSRLEPRIRSATRRLPEKPRLTASLFIAPGPGARNQVASGRRRPAMHEVKTGPVIIRRGRGITKAGPPPTD